MENNRFSFNRFGKYFLYDIKATWKNTGVLFLVLALFPVVTYLIYLLYEAIFTGNLWTTITTGEEVMKGPGIAVRLVFLVIVTFVLALVIPSRAYGHITEKKSGSEWLMLPASRFEKYLSMMLNTLIFIPLAFFAIYFLSDAAICLLDSSCGTPIVASNINGLMEEHMGEMPFRLVNNGFWIAFINYIDYAVVFLVGALIFKKWKIVGTIIALWAISTVFATAGSLLFIGTNMMTFAETMAAKITNFLSSNADHLDLIFNGFINLQIIIITAICAVIIWFRLKKLQH